MTDPFNDGEYRDEFEWEKEIRKDDDRVHDYLAELPRYIDLPDEDKVISYTDLVGTLMESVTTIIFAPGYLPRVTLLNVSTMTALFSRKFLGCRFL